MVSCGWLATAAAAVAADVTPGSVTVPMISPSGDVCGAPEKGPQWFTYNGKKRPEEATLMRVNFVCPRPPDDPARQPPGSKGAARALAAEHRAATAEKARLRRDRAAPRHRRVPQGGRPPVPGRARDGAVLRPRRSPQ